MATLAAARAPQSYTADQGFFTKLAVAIAGITVAGFVLNAAMGRVDIPAVPLWVHIHGLLMLSWLALFVSQNRLAQSGNLALHRKLGWTGAFVVAAIVGITCFAGVMSIALHRQPPFFSPPFFLALVLVEPVSFAGMVYAGIVNRRATETHRRLMFGGTIIAADAAARPVGAMAVLGCPAVLSRGDDPQRP